MLGKAFYDLHLHSCLSPCGDDDMTPNNIAGMASIKGLNIVAITDHNSCGNCPAFFSACSNYSLIAIAGAEITTAEDIHSVALFESLEGAMDFNEFLKTKRILIENDSAIFGKQIYMDGCDRVVGEEKHLLINAVDISIDDIHGIVERYGGIAYPAHIDKESNSIVGVFGTVPESDFTVYEFADKSNIDTYVSRFQAIKDRFYVSSSDAHYLWDINEQVNHFEILSDLSDANGVRSEIFSILRGDIK